jgi:hypothetical protein
MLVYMFDRNKTKQQLWVVPKKKRKKNATQSSTSDISRNSIKLFLKSYYRERERENSDLDMERASEYRIASWWGRLQQLWGLRQSLELASGRADQRARTNGNVGLHWNDLLSLLLVPKAHILLHPPDEKFWPHLYMHSHTLEFDLYN